MKRKVSRRKAERATATEILNLRGATPPHQSASLVSIDLEFYEQCKGEGINLADSLRLASSTIYMYFY